MAGLRRIICLVTNDLSYDQRMQRICGALAEAGNHVTLLGRKLPTSIELSAETFQQKRLKCWFNRGPLFYAEINIRFLGYLLVSKADVVNSVDADTLPAVRFARFLKKFLWIHDAHELYTEVPELVARPIKKKIWAYVERICLRQVDDIYTVCHSLAAYYEKISKKTVSVIRNLPEARLKDVVEPKSDNPEKVFLLYQGALNMGRCVDLYILAMHDLDAELWIAGEGDLSQELRSLAQKENLLHKIKFLGLLPPDDLRRVTEMAYIGLNVLENLGLSYYYSLSNKSLDYIQAEIPSIHSPFPEYQAINEAHGVFEFAEPNRKSITNSIKLLLNDHNVYDTLKKNCKIARLNLVWTTEKENLLAIYETR